MQNHCTASLRCEYPVNNTDHKLLTQLHRSGQSIPATSDPMPCPQPQTLIHWLFTTYLCNQTQ